MERVLIDRNEVLEFLEENFGFWEYIRLIKDNYDVDETTALSLADEVKDAIKNVIESMEVIEERKYTHCILHESEFDTYFPMYYYTCGECGESVDSLHADEEYKFCSHCGAQYDKIVRM